MKWPAVKLHYLLAYALLGALLPYVPIYLEDTGLNDARIGWVLAVFGLAVLVSPAAATLVADRWLTNRSLIATCYGLAAASLVGLGLAGSFPVILVTYTLFCLGFTAMIPLLDGLTLARVGIDRAGGSRVTFHSVRIWGSFGFMVPAVVLFFLLREGAVGPVSAVVVAAVTAGAGLVTAGVLPAGERRARPGAGWPTGAAWGLLREPAVLALVGSAGVLSLGVSVFYAFYPGYLVEVGVPAEWVGLIVSIGVVAEVGCMFVFGPLLHRIGVRGVMLFGAGATALRLALLWAVPTPTVAIATQVMHGPFVLALYVAPQIYLNQKAGDTFRNSAQGMYAMLIFGVARLVGSAAGGHVADAAADGERLTGLRTAFLFAAGLAAVALVWLALGFRDPEACERLREEH